MNTRGTLVRKSREKEYESVTDMVAAALSKNPSISGAAAEIGVAPNALRVFLNANGLAVIVETKARLVRADSMLPIEGD